jgi:hypothetical protein
MDIGMGSDVDIRTLPISEWQFSVCVQLAGVYILENTPPPPGEKYQPMSFGEKNMKRRGEKGGKCKRKKK